VSAWTIFILLPLFIAVVYVPTGYLSDQNKKQVLDEHELAKPDRQRYPGLGIIVFSDKFPGLSKGRD